MEENNEENKKKGIALIQDLKDKLKEVDALAYDVIHEIAEKADAASPSNGNLTTTIDVTRLEEIIRNADAIIYSPEVSGVLAGDLEQAEAIKVLINSIHTKVKRTIQSELVEKYPDLKVGIVGRDAEGKPTTYSEKAKTDRDKTLGGYFSEFVEKNFDESRVNYETKQLALLEATPSYAKRMQDPSYKGIGQDVEALKCVKDEKPGIDQLFDKISEYTPEKLQEVIDKVKGGNYTPEQITNVFKTALMYANSYNKANEYKYALSGVPDKEKAMALVMSGDPAQEKDIPPELVDVVRVLSQFLVYADTLSKDPKDKKMKDSILLGIITQEAHEDFGKINSPEQIVTMLTTVQEEVKNELSIPKNLISQKNRVLIEKVKSIPGAEETLFKIFPELANVVSLVDHQDEYDGAGGALYSFLDSFITRYDSGEFDKDIEALNDNVITYQKLNSESTLPSENGILAKSGDELFQELIEEQKELIERQKALVERKKRYQTSKRIVAHTKVEESNNVLDLIHLGKIIGFEMTQNVEYPEVSNYRELSEEQRLFTELEVLKGLSLDDYMMLRAKATEELERTDSRALVENGGFFSKAIATIRNIIGRLFDNRNIKTKKENCINDYIKTHYIRKMLFDNDMIQKNHEEIKIEGAKIKDEEIYLRDIDRQRAKRKKDNQEQDKDKGKSKEPEITDPDSGEKAD